MKNVYWRPRAVSRNALLLIALLSLGGLLVIENFRVETKLPYFNEKMQAAQLAKQAMEAIKNARAEKDLPPIDWETDPTFSGLIGLAMSSMTTTAGTLTSKQTTLNPNFAAVIVDMLMKAGVQEGDVVAVGCSGSFPAMNICTYAALESLKLKPVIISSATASQWGANHPDFLWLDMEKHLQENAKLFSFRSVAASVGGHEDRGLGLPEEARRQAEEAIKRNNVKIIEGNSFPQAVALRMGIYRDEAKGEPVKAFINVGGAMVSTGNVVGKHSFRSGLNLTAPPGIRLVEGVMPKFAKGKVPLIHLSNMVRLAARYGLPVAPVETPVVGDGDVYVSMEYNRWLALVVLAVILAGLYTFVRSSIGFRLLRSHSKSPGGTSLEPMV